MKEILSNIPLLIGLISIGYMIFAKGRRRYGFYFFLSGFQLSSIFLFIDGAATAGQSIFTAVVICLIILYVERRARRKKHSISSAGNEGDLDKKSGKYGDGTVAQKASEIHKSQFHPFRDIDNAIPIYGSVWSRSRSIGLLRRNYLMTFGTSNLDLKNNGEIILPFSARGRDFSFDYENAIPLEVRVRIRYKDQDGGVSTDDVRTRFLGRSYGSMAILGVCGKENNQKTFRVGSIFEVVDMASGEISIDARHFFKNKMNETPKGVVQNIVKEVEHHLNILVYAARMDGRIASDDYQRIKSVLLQICRPQMAFDEKDLMAVIQKWEVPEYFFKNSLKVLAGRPPAERAAVLGAMKSIVDRQKTFGVHKQAVVDMVSQHLAGKQMAAAQ